MNKRIIVTLIVLLFCVSCLTIVSADNNTNETVNNGTINMSNYVVPVSITSNGIEFNDGFTGFPLDLTKGTITTNDGFIREKTNGAGTENYVKLAIIEAYKQGCENELGKIIENLADRSYEKSDNKVINTIFDSKEVIGDEAIVELDDSIEATFKFEHLESETGSTSDCLAYSVTFKEITNGTNETQTNASDVNETNNTSTNASDVNGTNNTNVTNNTSTNTSDVNDTNNTTINKTENINKTGVVLNKLNKTATFNLNGNNTTVTYKNNTIIYKTKETPKNENLQDIVFKRAGNSILILIVIVVIVISAIYIMHGKR
ncbi:hypothetical protein TL18_01595 [Methanobrevibacter sp. YE315]|uniref:hypothetical protein n=1 Tax=Methanobrevibacter sp. YE315 TaxID=1609968 RepID=UPI000764EFF2|nr:hypothetical protein [Methanobrevibacter sp. YE315]AMD16846.1 hypothetical protein TL18_01595 [Methanobrevibacter sp. YE315]